MRADAAVAAIRRGEAVLLPTDTVYGLVADAEREAPVRLLYRLKNRPESMPCALLAADLDSILEALPELRGAGRVAAARALLPGPFTVVLPNPGLRYRWLTGSRPDTIGVRVPELVGDALDVVRRTGPVASTSANLHGAPEAARLEDVPEEIRRKAGAALDGGELPGTASTVVDLTGPDPLVLREGAVPAERALERLRALA